MILVFIGLRFLVLVKQESVPTQGGNRKLCPHEVDNLFSTRGGMFCFPLEVECSDFHTKWNEGFCPLEVALFPTQGGMFCFPHEVECSDFHLKWNDMQFIELGMLPMTLFLSLIPATSLLFIFFLLLSIQGIQSRYMLHSYKKQLKNVGNGLIIVFLCIVILSSFLLMHDISEAPR